jgi:hypothetical protein
MGTFPETPWRLCLKQCNDDFEQTDLFAHCPSAHVVVLFIHLIDRISNIEQHITANENKAVAKRVDFMI